MGDIRLDITAQGDTSEAQKEVRDLRQEVTETTAQTDVSVASAEAAAAALETEGAAAETTAQATATLSASQAAAAEAAAQLTLEELRQDAVLKEHRELLEAVSVAQSRANTAIAAMAQAAVAGGAAYRAAILEARNATAQLEAAIDAVRGSGGPVSPTAIAQLQAYDAAVVANTASLEKNAAASKIASTSANLMRDNAAGAARAVAGMGGELAATVLGIGAAVVALDLVPTLLEKVDEKSKAWADDLVALFAGLENATGAVDKHGKELSPLSDEYQKAANATVDFTRAQIAMAAGLIAETTDVKASIIGWQAHEAALHGSLDQYPALAAAVKEAGGAVRASLQQVVVDTQSLVGRYEEILREDGEGAANAWAVASKSAFDRIVSYYQEAGIEVPTELAKISQAIGLTSTAEKTWAAQRDLRDKYLDAVNAAVLLIAQLKASKEEFGNSTTAVLGLAKETDKLIDTLQKLKLADDAEVKTRDQLVASLRLLQSEHGVLSGKILEEESATDRLVKRLDALVKAFADNDKALQANLEKIEQHRKAQIEASQATTAKVVTDLQTQLKAIQAEHDSGVISQNEYNVRINTLFADLATAKRKEYDQEQAINRDQDKAREETIAKSTEATKKLVDSNKDLGDSYAAIKTIVEDYKTSHQGVLDRLIQEQAKTVEAAAAVDVHAESQKKFKEEIGHVLDNIGKANDGLDKHRGKHAELHTVVPTTTKHVADLGGELHDLSTTKIPQLDAQLDGLIAKLNSVAAAAANVGAAASQAFAGAEAVAEG